MLSLNTHRSVENDYYAQQFSGLLQETFENDLTLMCSRDTFTWQYGSNVGVWTNNLCLFQTGRLVAHVGSFFFDQTIALCSQLRSTIFQALNHHYYWNIESNILLLYKFLNAFTLTSFPSSQCARHAFTNTVLWRKSVRNAHGSSHGQKFPCIHEVWLPNIGSSAPCFI